jgi:hypothetical protein
MTYSPAGATGDPAHTAVSGPRSTRVRTPHRHLHQRASGEMSASAPLSAAGMDQEANDADATWPLHGTGSPTAWQAIVAGTAGDLMRTSPTHPVRDYHDRHEPDQHQPLRRWDVVASALQDWSRTLRLCAILVASAAPTATPFIWLVTRH